MNKSKKSIVLLLLLFFTFSGCIFSINKDKGKKTEDDSSGREIIDKKNNMGINLWFLNSWAKAYTFADVMKEASYKWMRYVPELKNSVDAEIDEFGNPKSDARKLIFDNATNIKGVYTLVFKGKAESINLLMVNNRVSDIQYDEATNTTTAKVEILAEGTIVYIDFKGTKRTPNSEPESGVTDVHLYRPGYPADGSATFTNELLAAVRKFQVIRFMEWNDTNNNPSQKWSERTLPEYSTQDITLKNSITSTMYTNSGRGGVAYEYMIELCNESECDMWITIPANADDEYISNLAKLIHYGRKGADGKDYAPLKSNLKVYLEYGNEMWNTGFYGMLWLGNLYKSAKLDSTHPVVYDGNTEYYRGLFRYLAWRTVGISNIFRNEFGDSQMISRIRPVIEGQSANTIWMEYALEFIEKYYATPRDGMPARNVNYFIYGGGGAAYYGINMSKTDYTDSEYIINHYFDEGMYPDKVWLEQVKKEAILLKNYGLKRVAYEGGPGLDIYDSINKKSALNHTQMRAINANPKMKDMVIKCQDVWSENDGDLLCYYALGAAVPWEFTSSQVLDSNGGVYSLETPKMLGIKELRNRDKADINFGNSIEKEIVMADTKLETRLGQDTTGYNATFGVSVIGGEDIFGMALNVKKEGKYKMMMKGRVPGDPVLNPEKGISEVRLNGKLIGNINLKVNGAGGAKSAIENSTEIEMYIPKGMSVIRVTNLNRMAIYSMVFTEVTESKADKNKKVKK